MTDTLFREKAPSIMALLMADFGLDAEGAAAILGNLGHESGGFKFLQEIKPTVEGSAGGWGWAQWTASRRVAFDAYVERNSLDPASDKANYGWLWVELKGEYAKAISAIKAATGLYNKVVAFELAFEKAGVKAYDSRLAWANKALAAFHAAGDPAAAKPAQEILSPLAKPPPEMEARLARIEQFLVPFLQQLAGATSQPQPPTPPVPVEPAKPKDSSLGMNVATCVLGVLASLTASKYGVIGPPVGPGSTAAGFLLPIASAGLAAVGVPAWVLPLVGRLLSAGASRLPGAQK